MTTAPDALFPGKHFISTVLEALDTKTRMTGALAQRYLMRAAMAGMIVAVFYVVNYAIVGVFDGGWGYVCVPHIENVTIDFSDFDGNFS